MAEEATQPATQLVIDPRRYGQQNSGMTTEDLTDIFCTLHPITMPACAAVSRIHDKTPEHTTNASLPRDTAKDFEGHNPANSPDSFALAERGLTSCDLALRLSGTQKSLEGGYVFGRHAARCDFELGIDDPKRRISNIHFRIFIMEHGTIMIEDSSTNGTLVNNRLLRKGANGQLRHTIDNGTIIGFVPAFEGEDVIKFIVRVPNRDGIYEDMFNDNLDAYLARLRDGQKLRDLQAGIEDAVPSTVRAGEAPDIFAKENRPPPKARTEPERNRKHKGWRGGEKYNKLDVIGKGAFATVYMLTTKFDGSPYACKELEKRRFIKNGVLDQKVENEIKILSRIKHPNIVQFIEHIDYYEHLYLILEFVPHGDLGSLITPKTLLTEMGAKTMTIQLLSALEYLHSMGITHRDIKPDNILIQEYQPFHVKLTDFGLSKMIEQDEETFLRTFCGTLLYCAPEVYTEYREYGQDGRRNRGQVKYTAQQYSSSVDLWSLGAVLFYSLSGLPPFPAKNGTTPQALLHTIMTTTLDVEPLREVGLSGDGVNFVWAMLNRLPEHRATIYSCSKHDWLAPEIVCNQTHHEGGLDNPNNTNLPLAAQQEELEQRASQLSFVDVVDELDDNMDDENHDFNTETTNQRENITEIPSSFPSADSTSMDDGSFVFDENVVGRNRLFGEIDPAALRSSGVIASNHLNLALSQSGQNFDSEFAPDLDSTIIKMDNDNLNTHEVQKDQHLVSKLGAKSDMSLFGAESMVNNLYMGSPSPAATNAPSPQSPPAEMPPPPPRSRSSAQHQIKGSTRQEPENDMAAHSMGASILGRRLVRDDSGLSAEDPHAKRPATSRALSQAGIVTAKADIPIPSTEPRLNTGKPFNRKITGIYSEKVHWDPRDRSTHVLTGRTMTDDEYNQMKQEAAAIGTTAYSNSPSFPALLKNVHTRRSQSTEAEALKYRGQSEPGDRPKSRDGITQAKGSPPVRGQTVPSSGLQSTVIIGPTDGESPLSMTTSQRRDTGSRPTSQQRAVESFTYQTPPAVLGTLARLYTTTKSDMPPLLLSITTPVFVWGRGSDTTVRYWDTDYSRVPKYAINLVYLSETASKSSRGHDGGLWYILAKRGAGLRVNGREQNSNDTSEEVWVGLKHNDHIRFWASAIDDVNPKQENAFVFECFSRPSTTNDPVIATGMTKEILAQLVARERARAGQMYQQLRSTQPDYANQEKAKFAACQKADAEGWVGKMRS